jgi:hypothetical protein
MRLEHVKNPVWADAEHTAVDLTIKLEGANVEYPFTASPNDVEPHGRALFEVAIAGQFGDIAEYVPPLVEPKAE